MTGKAGTGKTFLLKTVINWLRLNHANYIGHDPVMIAAPTGLAAKNLSGKTLHNLLTLPVQNEKTNYRDASQPLNERVLRKKRSALKGKKFLIIDEVSMVGNNMLNVIDLRLRQIFNSEASFGGMHVIFAGDFLQLPPVRDSWSFKNPLFDELEPIFLEKNMRQNEDKPWCALLDRMSIGQLTEHDINKLETRRVKEEAVAEIECDLRLFPTTDEVQKFNDRAQKLLQSKTEQMKAVDRFGVNDLAAGLLADETRVPQRNSDCGGLHKELKLSIGSRVMLIRNIGDGLVNGSMGYVAKMQKDANSVVDRIWINFDDKSSGIPLKDPNVNNTVPLEKIDCEFLYKGRYITRTQFPIIPCWSVTIHKAQGQTVNKAVVNVEKAFCGGQAYVAFSRIRNFDGVYVHGNFSKKGKGSFKVNDDALTFQLKKRTEYRKVKQYLKGYKINL